MIEIKFTVNGKENDLEKSVAKIAFEKSKKNIEYILSEDEALAVNMYLFGGAGNYSIKIYASDEILVKIQNYLDNK